MNTHDAWEKIYQNREWGSYPTEHVIRFVARNYYAAQREKIKILDFGCGMGAHTWYLAREGFDTYAFDISETAIERLQARMEREHLHASMALMDGCELLYDKDFFDAVIDNVSIQSNCIADIQKMYRNVYEVIKPGGKLLTVVFGRETTGYGSGIKIEDGTYENITEGRLQGIGCRHFFEEDELERILRQCGFQNVVIEHVSYTDQGSVVSQLIAAAQK